MKTTDMNYTPIQLKLPVDMERMIEINDPVYTFNEVVGHIDLNRYFAEKDCRTGRRLRYQWDTAQGARPTRLSFVRR